MLDHLRRIVVEGPIGVGKTALARRLAETLHTGQLLDAARANPFLERFYRDPSRYALQVQLAFLEQRAVQLREWQATLLSGKRVVGNFLGAKDKLFAQLTLPADELALYEAAAERVPFAQRVDLVVVLQATPAQLRERISRRNAPGEGSIDEAYLQRLCDAYVELLHRYDDAPMLIVDTARFNPVDNDLDFRTLLTRIDTMRGRKAFLNLAAP